MGWAGGRATARRAAAHWPLATGKVVWATNPNRPLLLRCACLPMPQVGRLLGVEPLVAEVAREAAAAAAPPGAAVDEADVERACSQLSERLSFRTADGSQMVGSPVGPYRMLGGHAAEAPVRHWRAHPAAGRLMSVGVRTVYVVLTTVSSVWGEGVGWLRGLELPGQPAKLHQRSRSRAACRLPKP